MSCSLHVLWLKRYMLSLVYVEHISELLVGNPHWRHRSCEGRIAVSYDLLVLLSAEQSINGQSRAYKSVIQDSAAGNSPSIAIFLFFILRYCLWYMPNKYSYGYHWPKKFCITSVEATSGFMYAHKVSRSNIACKFRDRKLREPQSYYQ